MSSKFAYLWNIIQRVLGNEHPGLGIDQAMSELSTSEKYLISLAAGDDAAAGTSIGAMWRRLNAEQRALVVTAWTGEVDEIEARTLAKRMLDEVKAALSS